MVKRILPVIVICLFRLFRLLSLWRKEILTHIMCLHTAQKKGAVVGSPSAIVDGRKQVQKLRPPFWRPTILLVKPMVHAHIHGTYCQVHGSGRQSLVGLRQASGSVGGGCPAGDRAKAKIISVGVGRLGIVKSWGWTKQLGFPSPRDALRMHAGICEIGLTFS